MPELNKVPCGLADAVDALEDIRVSFECLQEIRCAYEQLGDSPSYLNHLIHEKAMFQVAVLQRYLRSLGNSSPVSPEP